MDVLLHTSALIAVVLFECIGGLHTSALVAVVVFVCIGG